MRPHAFVAFLMSSNNSWDVPPKACAPARPKASRKSQAQSSKLKIRVANRRAMRRVDSSDAAQTIHRVHAVCEERLHFGGPACTRLTALTDTRTIAFAKPAAKDSQTPVCNNLRVKRLKQLSNATELLRRRGRETEAPRRRRGIAASKKKRKRKR